MKFHCRTTFDITNTGVTGHYKSSRVPFVDRYGKKIVDELSWNRARNQQRNWETLMQLLSLRAQVSEHTSPTKVNGVWEFEFAVETPDVFGDENDPVAVLRSDTDGVPMLINLETSESATLLVTSGPRQNIWFKALT